MNQKTFKKLQKFCRHLICEKITERISLRQSIYIAKRISFLLEAGISLPKAFDLIGQQMKKRGIVLKKMADKIANGQSIGETISQTKLFGVTALPIIKIGEESGTLAESFSALSEELEKRALLQQKIIGALLYPACITCGMLLLVIMLMTFVFPKMLGVFESLNVTLPLSTRILIWISNGLRQYGILVGFICSAVFILIMISYRRFEMLHLKIDRIILKIPLVSNLVRTYFLASISNVVGLLLTNNSSLITSLKVAEKTCGNYVYRGALNEITKQVSAGIALGQVLNKFPNYFTQEYCDLVTIGEQTGKLSETFTYAHTIYSRDLDVLTKSLSSSIEPILMVVIGLAIGVVAFSVVSPMYSITSHLHST